MISQRRILGFSITVLALTQLLACTKNKPVNNTQSPTADVFSNRPIVAVPDLYIVTLASPPILKIATKGKSGWIVPDAGKKAILDEQTQFEQKIKTLAPGAEIVYRYHMTINALAIYSAKDISEVARGIPGVRSVSPARQMARAQDIVVTPAVTAPLVPASVNSVNYIGAEEAHKLGFTGKGMRIGILDTGIDYTHKMLGGSGVADDYKAIDPAQPSAAFPNAKVVGGLDLVGTGFNAASPIPADRLPHPDANPLDEAGHGSHVAGTIAGVGDGVKTYDGVAPDAQLYAIKVFGKAGSTADAVVIAGFEFAADPNGDLNPDDQLDVINMSLGGGFGQPQVLYTEAVRNLSQAGTLVVASAGNSGAVDYIVGAPSTSDDALSVAASIDGAAINWQFPAVRIVSTNNPDLIVKAVEGPISKPLSEIGPIEGDLVDIGFGDVDLANDVKVALSGKVALIQRGKVAFAVKLKRAADAGAIGAVVYNNDPTKPIPMGGEGKVDIPAVMITQALGMQLVDEMKLGPAHIQFKTDKKIEEPDNIDTITDFSSKGPRSEDNLLKPEIAAPGQNITSAGMGTGTDGVHMDGTSMAAPHMTGAMALIKQAHPELSALELKSIAMGTSKILSKAGEIPLTQQGAGRVQIVDAIKATVVSETASISLGRVQLQQEKTETRKVVLRNLSGADVDLTTETRSTPGMTIELPAQVTIPANGTTEVEIKFTLKLLNPAQFTFELDGRIFLKQGAKTVLQIPALAIRTQASMIQAAATPVTGSIALTNTSPNAGLALAFNLIGEEPRKPTPGPADAWKSRSCDLQSVGYRILRKATPAGAVDMIQFAFKIYDPVTTWHLCSVSVLIDSQGTGTADQEIAGVTGGGLEGVDKAPFHSVLLDAAKARDVRVAYEKDLASGKEGTPNYTPAVIGIGPMAPFSQSTIAILEVPLDALTKSADGSLNVKLASQAENSETFESDKFLGGLLGQWIKIPAKLEDQAYFGMDEVIAVDGKGATATVTKGPGTQKLVMYYPLNEFTANGADGQQQVVP
jgi:minor extracellular serine protease Vpr